MLRLIALGGTRVVRDDQPLDAFGQPSLRNALLFFVGVEGETTREAAAALLWPDKEPERARHSLSQAVYELNRELSPAPIETAGEVLRLAPGISVDVAELDAAMLEGDHERVLDLYAGPFAADVYLASTRPFEGWTDRVRSRLARSFREAARAVVAARRDAADQEGALAVAERWVGLDPLDDEAQHAALELLAGLGRRSEAVRRFERYARALREELEIEPLESTVELIEGLRSATPAGAGGDEGASAPAPTADGPAPAPAPTADGPAPVVPTAPAPAPRPRRSFLEELQERKVFRTAVFYGVVVFALLEGADLILPALGVPPWVFTGLVVAAVVGFPATLLLAWAFDITPEGVESTDSRVVHGGRGVRSVQLALVGVVVVASVGLGALTLRRVLAPAPALNPDRIVVFPLVVRDPGIDRTVGEEVATMIGNALDGTGPLRWIDGWPLLSAEQRENVRSLLLEDAHALAAGRDAGLLVIGSLQTQGDSAVVSLDLRDTTGDSLLARASAAGAATEAWRVGLAAVNGLLPHLIQTDVPDFGVEFTERNPEAVANFLLGEASARRASYDEALELYRRSFGADSQFGLAALRGAQAASWRHRSLEAGELVGLALTLTLEPRDRSFALGVQAQVAGDAAGALEHLRAAIRIDPEMALAHLQVGEVFTHLVPRSFHPDSAETAFLRAMSLDPTAVNVLLHPLEAAIRRGDVARAEAMLERFLLARPDPRVEHEIGLMLGCVRDGPSAVDWTVQAGAWPLEVLSAATSLAIAGAALGCAEAGFRAVLAGDTATDGFELGRRWNALYSLQSLLLAQGRDDEAIELMRAATWSLEALRSVASREPVDLSAAPGPDVEGCELDSSAGVSSSETFYLADAATGYEVGVLPERVACQYERRWGPGYRDTRNASRLWTLGVWEASRGNGALTGELAARLREGGVEGPSRLAVLVADALDGHAALSMGDTATAVERFRALEPTGSAIDLEWHLAEPLGLEKITLARLLLAGGEAREALSVAEAIDASPSAYLLYLPASLEIRRDAAEALGFGVRAETYRQRLAGLRGTDAPRTRAALPPNTEAKDGRSRRGNPEAQRLSGGADHMGRRPGAQGGRSGGGGV